MEHPTETPVPVTLLRRASKAKRFLAQREAAWGMGQLFSKAPAQTRWRRSALAPTSPHSGHQPSLWESVERTPVRWVSADSTVFNVNNTGLKCYFYEDQELSYSFGVKIFQ